MQRPLQQISDTTQAIFILWDYHANRRRHRQTQTGTGRHRHRQTEYTQTCRQHIGRPRERPRESNPGFVDISLGSPPTGPPPPRISRGARRADGTIKTGPLVCGVFVCLCASPCLALPLSLSLSLFLSLYISLVVWERVCVYVCMCVWVCVCVCECVCACVFDGRMDA